MRKELSNSPRWFVKGHPNLLCVAIASAVTTPFLNHVSSIAFVVGMLVYGVSLFAAMFTRDAFIAEHSRQLLRSRELVDHAFGIDKVSLLVFNSFEQANFPSGLNQPDIGKIIKLVKTGQDYLNTTYGYYDYARKAFIAGLFALPVTAWTLLREHRQDMEEFRQTVSSFMASQNFFAPLPLVLTLLFMVGASILVYAVAFGDQKLERQKKRYLLWLNLLYEGWQR